MKKKVSIILFLIMCLSSVSAFAAVGNYAGKVRVFGDLESTLVTKTTSLNFAYNQVDYIQRGTLVSWVELNSNGANVSEDVAYTTTGSKFMNFYNNVHNLNPSMRLNISTSAGTFETVDTFGTWSPN